MGNQVRPQVACKRRWGAARAHGVGWRDIESHALLRAKTRIKLMYQVAGKKKKEKRNESVGFS